ncbi:sensor histidine kinase [Thiosocius teredinicola]|uniref:sensor histidine kinase n=1 Tax=Thiosocius teredinicola TaxID=1973002 RepID=UPI00099112BB
MSGSSDSAELLREALIDLERLRDREARLRQTNEMLLQGLHSLSFAETPKAMFDELSTLMRESMGCRDVFVLRIAEDGVIDVPFASNALFENSRWYHGNLFDRVVSGETVASFDVSQISEWQVQPEGVHKIVTSALHGPLTYGGRSGLLIATSPERGHFSRSHTQIMRRMLLLIEQALVHIEIHESQQREQALLIDREQLKEMVDERTAELAHAMQLAVEANESKSQLVASMAHELRTPLHAIIAFSDMALSPDHSTDQQKMLRYFNRIQSAGTTLLNLVDELLDLSKMESGKLEFSFQPAEMSGLVNAVIGEFESMAHARSVKLFAAVDPVVGVVDADRIKQVVRNLISNALKFSPSGSTMHITLTGNQSQLLLCVDDQGEGIADADKERIFDDFVQTANGAAKVGGSGLGLAICREIVRAHHGRIWVENASGGGASFRVSLPVGAGLARHIA